MKFLTSIITFFFIAVQLFAQSNEKLQEAEAVVEKHIAAVGGAAALNSVQSVISEGTQNYYGIVETLKITYEKDKLLRYDIDYNGQQGYWMVSKTEGGEHFPWEASGPVTFSDAVLKGMQGNLQWNAPLLNYKTDGNEIVLMGKDTIDKKSCSKINLTSKKGNLICTYWINNDDYMVVRTEKYYFIRNKSNDKFQALDRLDYSDYRPVGNIKLSFVQTLKTIINKSIVGEKETRFFKIETNQPVNSALYRISRVK